MSEPGRRKVYVVRRKGRGFSYEYGGDGETETMALFAERPAAEDYLLQCERSLWPTMRREDVFWDGPYRPMSPLDFTNFEPPIFLDWLEDADIPLPADLDTQSWLDWWNVQREELTEDQLRHLFMGLPKLSFHEICEVDWIEDEESWTAEQEWTRDRERLHPDPESFGDDMPF